VAGSRLPDTRSGCDRLGQTLLGLNRNPSLRHTHPTVTMSVPAGTSGKRPGRVFALIVTGLLAACSSYHAHEAPRAAPESMPSRYRAGSLSLGADAYSQPDRQEQMFGEDLTRIAVLPIQAVVTNDAEQAVTIAPENFRLALPRQDAAAPRPSFEISSLLAPEIGIADYAAAGVGALGGIGGAIGAIAGRLIGFMGAAALDWSRQSTLQARGEDYERKGWKAVKLGRNQSASGFLFFVIPPGTAPFDEAVLHLTVQQSDNHTMNLSITLKGLGCKGLPAAKPEEPDKDDQQDAS